MADRLEMGWEEQVRRDRSVSMIFFLEICSCSGWLYHLFGLTVTLGCHLGSLQCCAADSRFCGHLVGTYRRNC